MVRVFLPHQVESLVRSAHWMASSSAPSTGYRVQHVSVSMSLLSSARRPFVRDTRR